MTLDEIVAKAFRASVPKASRRLPTQMLNDKDVITSVEDIPG
jgi:hypothetical protein